MSPSTTSTTRCDNTSVGVLISDGAGRWLVFDRNTPPAGVAPAAGHVDDHGGWEAAAVAEVREELGLNITSLREIAHGWRDNACRRSAGGRGTGHSWKIYLAEVTGELAPSQRETRNARWLTTAELQELAGRTAAYAAGGMSAAQFAAAPGIEPVWVRWLADAQVIRVTHADAAATERLAAQPVTPC